MQTLTPVSAAQNVPTEEEIRTENWATGQVLRSDVGAVTHQLVLWGLDFKLYSEQAQDLFTISVGISQDKLDEFLNDTHRSVIFTTTVGDIRELAWSQGIEIHEADALDEILDRLRHCEELAIFYQTQVVKALETELWPAQDRPMLSPPLSG